MRKRESARRIVVPIFLLTVWLVVVGYAAWAISGSILWTALALMVFGIGVPLCKALLDVAAATDDRCGER